MKPLTQILNPLTPGPLVNHIALVVDVSGSMEFLSKKLEESLREQILNIRAQAYNSGQETYVSLYLFNHNVSRLEYQAFPEAVNIPHIRCSGDTALLDAVDQAMRDLSMAKYAGEKRTSFLIITLTDGQENRSRSTYASALEREIKERQREGRWSFAFMGPRGCTYSLTKLGVPAGNITEWEQTERALEQVSYLNNMAIGSYMKGRSMGLTSTASLYTDVAGLTQKDLGNLDDLTRNFRRLKVDKEAEISKFCQDKLGAYPLGEAFYQLTKPETIQSHKDVLIEDRKTGHLYGGNGAKNLIGIASGPGVKVRVKPGNHGNYNIFVNSTSMNRKLVRGTDLLVKK